MRKSWYNYQSKCFKALWSFSFRFLMKKLSEIRIWKCMWKFSKLYKTRYVQWISYLSDQNHLLNWCKLLSITLRKVIWRDWSFNLRDNEYDQFFRFECLHSSPRRILKQSYPPFHHEIKGNIVISKKDDIVQMKWTWPCSFWCDLVRNLGLKISELKNVEQ